MGSTTGLPHSWESIKSKRTPEAKPLGFPFSSGNIKPLKTLAMTEAAVTEETPQNPDTKRGREDETNGTDVVETKKQKVVEQVEATQPPSPPAGPVSLGPKTFTSSVDMFSYFYKFVHYWPLNIDINKYEYMILLDLLKKGHPEPEQKIGAGISAFQVRSHPMWKSRCFFMTREDGIVDDFSFRKYVDHILPLPEDMKVQANANKAPGGHGGKGGGYGGGGRRGGRGRGRGRGRY